MESHHVHVHICHQCGWSYPNHHPSAKQRRAHKKICGKKLHESQDVVNEEKRGCLVDRQVSNKSVEEDYSDAVTEFTDSDLKTGDLRTDWIVGSKDMETDDLGQKMVLNESGGSETVCFYEDSLQVQEDCARPSDIDCSFNCTDCYNEKGACENMLAPVKLASMPPEGYPEEMAEGCEEKIAVKSSTSLTMESGVTADMEIHNTTSGYANPVFLSCKVDESDNITNLEDNHQQAPVYCKEVPTGQGTGSFDANDVSRGLEAHTIVSDAQDFHCDNQIECLTKLKSSSVEDADKTGQVQFVDAYGSLGSLHEDRKADHSIEVAVIGNGADNTTVDELMLSVVNTVPCVQNSSSTEDGNYIIGLGDVDSQDCHSENYVEDSNKYETISVGTSVSGTDEAGFVSSDCSIGPLKGERKYDDSLEAKLIQNGAESMASAVNTVSNILNISSNENSDKIVGLEDDSQDCLCENNFESSKNIEIRNIETSVSGTDQTVSVGATASTKPLQGERENEYIIEAEMIQNGSEKATSGKSIPSAGIDSSFSGTEQVVFTGADDSTKPLLEETGNEHITEAGVIQNGVERTTIEKLMVSAGAETSFSGIGHVVFSGADDNTKPLLGEGEIKYIIEAEVAENGAKNAKSGETMVAAVNSVPCLLNPSAIEDGDKVCSRISEEDEKSVLEKQLKSMALVILKHADSQFGAAEDYGGSISGSTIPLSTFAMSSSSVAAAAAETLPGNDSRAQKEETQVPESTSTLSCEGQQLSNTNIPEVPSSKTLDESSKAEKEHCVSEIQTIQNPQQSHASTLKAALDEVLQGRKKNEEIAEKMTSRSVRAPLKSFLAEPIFDNREEETAPGHPKLPTYEDGATSKVQAKTVPTTTGPELSTNNGSKKYTDREWDSPARLPKNEHKRRVRWPPFLCCLHVPSDRANLVGAD